VIQIYILLGGVADGFFGLPDGWDGVVDSAGMEALANSLKTVRGVKLVATYDWGDWDHCIDPIVANKGADKIAVIGYSGGGSRATYLADTLYYKKPMANIDLMVLYDPSPSWQMEPIGANVKSALCYHNTDPMMFGLGGGVLTDTDSSVPITTIDIAEQHLLVQADQKLHQRTIAAVSALAGK
jgi:hypothetical protein